MPTHILLITCPDEPGLVYKITGVLYRHGCNVISNQEFVDGETSTFFMRTEYAGTPDLEAILAETRALLPASASVRLTESTRRRVALMATKEHHCLGDLLLRHHFGELNAEICAVISNYNTLRPFVEKFGIPFHAVSHVEMERRAHELKIEEQIGQYNPDYVVLAKYMRVLTPAFVAAYPSRIINIHHSFLPAFIGANPYRQAFERGVKLIGATAHFVTDELDTGPIIAQDVLPVNHTFRAQDMAQAGRDVEKLVLAKALRLVLAERVFLSGNRTIIFE